MPLPPRLRLICMAILFFLAPYFLPTGVSVLVQVTLMAHLYTRLRRIQSRVPTTVTALVSREKYDRLWVRFKRMRDERNLLRGMVAELESELGAAREAIRNYIRERDMREGDDDTLLDGL